MDTRKYSAGLITRDDVRDGPRVEKIIEVSENETHGCLVLHFESGDQFYCWNNYVRVLNAAWGYESEDWLEQELELSLGHYTDRKTGEQKETVDITPVSPAKPGAFTRKPGKAIAVSGGSSSSGGLSDDIPFEAQWR